MALDVYDILEERGGIEAAGEWYTGQTTGPGDYAVGAGTAAGQREIALEYLGLDGDDEPGILDKLGKLGMIGVLLVAGVIVLVILK